MINEKLNQEIKKLKKQNKAVILAHYYQNEEIQKIADFVGDSYQLSVIAKNTNADVIVFCGVRFMAETAKILSPDKKVVLPSKNAGCYMVNTISVQKLAEYKKNHPKTKIIAYVNTSAEIKAMSDVCVTSANALKIIAHYENEEVLYIPDHNLARYANYLNPAKPINYWNGCCKIHDDLRPEMVDSMKRLYPDALVIVHPEAPLEVILKADFVGSTSEMLKFIKKSSNQRFIIGTEIGIIYQMQKENVEKEFIPLTEDLVCQTMKLTTLTNLRDALLEIGTEYEEIQIDENILSKAKLALERMLELS